jgi:hypothetical protein
MDEYVTSQYTNECLEDYMKKGEPFIKYIEFECGHFEYVLSQSNIIGKKIFDYILQCLRENKFL